MSATTDARVASLKHAFERITAKRELKVITKLVNDYRTGTLTPENTYSAIIAISELRLARGDIEARDL